MSGTVTRTLEVKCPNGCLEMSVRTSAGIVEDIDRELDPTVTTPDVPHPAVSPEDVLSKEFDRECPGCGGSMEVTHG